MSRLDPGYDSSDANYCWEGPLPLFIVCPPSRSIATYKT